MTHFIFPNTIDVNDDTSVRDLFSIVSSFSNQGVTQLRVALQKSKVKGQRLGAILISL